MLQVAVHGHDDLAARLVESGSERCGLAVVARQLHQSHAGIDCGDPAQLAVGAVDAAIVDEDNLVRQADGAEDRRQSLVQFLESRPFVEERNDDGELRANRTFFFFRHVRSALSAAALPGHRIHIPASGVLAHALHPS